MTTVLVLSASRHGSTAQIGTAIADELTARGIEVVHADVSEVPPFPTDFDGFVLGSAVYAGHWVAEMRHFIEEHRTLLASKPTWLFSSGPLGDMTDGVEEPHEVLKFVELLGAGTPRLRGAARTGEDLSLVERAAVRFVHTPSRLPRLGGHQDLGRRGRRRLPPRVTRWGVRDRRRCRP